MIQRCAIYTRKSSEEGLAQDFNSLAAQREACEAYIKSQASEGWRVVPALYDDGGFSGGTLIRPGLQRLLADIESGAVDVIVVYKVDRLTRSLADFAKIVERLDAKGASFVSVTQSFNTTTSMGRLTLNVLLSFAQFEREVTSERIRDKIAASKRKGLWMGGWAPLGYVPAGRTLNIDETDAENVRWIFQRYLKVSSIPALAHELEAKGIYSKLRHVADGRLVGGKAMRVGQIRYLLRNRTYLGEIVHGELTYPGLHAPIIDKDLFDAVQARLKERGGQHVRRKAKLTAHLRGKLVDERGRRMCAIAASKGGGRFLYYIPVPKSQQEGVALRLPITALDDIVDAACRRLFDVPLAEMGERLSEVRASSAHLVLRVRAAELDSICARLRPQESASDERDLVKVVMPLALRRWRGGSAFFDGMGKQCAPSPPDLTLLKALARAHHWRAMLADAPTIAAAAKQAGASPSYFWRLTRLAYLAPDITRQVASGAPSGFVSLHRLMTLELPRDWPAQRRAIGH